MARLSRSKTHMGMGLFWKISAYSRSRSLDEEGARAVLAPRFAGPASPGGGRCLVPTLLTHQPAYGGILLHGPADVISLREVATDAAQRAQCLAALDALGHQAL